MGARRSWSRLLPLLLMSWLAGCDDDAVESWLTPPSESGPSLYSAEELTSALDALRTKAGHPISALSLLIYDDHVVLQAKSLTDPESVDQFVYRQELVSGPERVKLLGKGRLADNLFPLDAANLRSVESLVAVAVEKSGVPEGKVDRVLLKRNLPESMDIQFRVFVTNQRRDAVVDADKDGRVIAP